MDRRRADQLGTEVSQGRFLGDEDRRRGVLAGQVLGGQVRDGEEAEQLVEVLGAEPLRPQGQVERA